jgi:hypothetical protein
MYINNIKIEKYKISDCDNFSMKIEIIKLKTECK